MRPAAPTPTVPVELPTTTTQPPPASPSASAVAATATTSQGGTIWTRCSGPDSIVYIAALPRSGYQRTLDLESSSGITQQFENGTSISKIQAACSNGVVHAEVEQESSRD
jgi:hypothetical protein